jgi:hypothetical protein
MEEWMNGLEEWKVKWVGSMIAFVQFKPDFEF